MRDFWNKFLMNTADNTSGSDKVKNLQIATCALFLEIANSDSEFTAEERSQIIEIMKVLFSLEETQVYELLNLAEDHLSKSVSLYETTSFVDKNMSADDKYELVKNLWRLVFSDSVLNKYEDHLMHTIGTNLKLSHRELIAAKLEVKSEMNY